MKIGELVCDVYDENSITANQKMGTAKFSMKKFANSLGKDYEYTMDVIGVAKGQTIGKLTVYYKNQTSLTNRHCLSRPALIPILSVVIKLVTF